MKKLTLAVLLFGLAMPLTACGDDEPDDLEDAVDEVGDEMEDAADDMEDAVDPDEERR